MLQTYFIKSRPINKKIRKIILIDEQKRVGIKKY